MPGDELLETDISIPYADTHFHALQMSGRGLDVGYEVRRAIANGMVLGVEVGVDPAEFEHRRAILDATPGILRSSGIGPSSSNEADESLFEMLRSQIDSGELCAIGEIGLDWYRNYAPRKTQIDTFTRQLGMAREAGLPVIIHDRDADDDVISALRSCGPPVSGVMHCFSSDWKTARDAIDLGLHISFSGNVTFANAGDLREVAKLVPANRLLAETDAPYLAPVPRRGKPNTPAYCIHTCVFLAHIRGEDPSELASQIVENARDLFLGDPSQRYATAMDPE